MARVKLDEDQDSAKQSDIESKPGKKAEDLPDASEEMNEDEP